jgi:VanZ family protein
VSESVDAASPEAGPRSRLPHILAAVYALAIVFASLQPFGDFLARPADAPFWLFSPGRVRAPRFDVLVNLLAYLPFGAFIALVPHACPPAGAWRSGRVAGFAMSFVMESLQAWIPPRDANVVDLVSNTLGALAGAAIAATIARRPAARARLSRWRRGLFPAGRHRRRRARAARAVARGAGQSGHPAVRDRLRSRARAHARRRAPEADAAANVIEAAESAFHVLGVGLFLALLVRHRRHAGAAVLLLIGAALLLKGMAAILLLKPAAWDGWLRPGISTGVAVGALALLAAIVLPRPAMIALCGIALLSSLLTPLVASDLLAARAPLTLFSWRYGHLLNFNGLTHTALLLWPLAAAAWLFALSGRPAWGAPTAGLQ